MFCSISGTVPEDPVISRNSGHLYERRLVEKYVQDNGKDPVTGESLTLEDLLPVKSNKAVKPRPQAATSIPGLLGLLHTEWDAVMLEAHSLRQSLGTVRQELSHALYQHDAACRVIARLVKERDAARDALEAARKAAPAEPVANGRRMEDEEMEEAAAAKRAKSGMTEEITESLTSFSKELSKGRKKRVISAALSTAEEIEAFTLIAANPVHKTTQPGILALDLAPGNEDVVVTGGVDHCVTLYDCAAQRLLSTLSGHAKRVTAVSFLRDGAGIASGSADRTVRLWGSGLGNMWSQKALLTHHSAEVTAVTVHPSRDYFSTASMDRSWAFYDATTADLISQVEDESAGAGYTAAQFHPDGLILGVGSQDARIRIWEIRTAKNVATFEGHVGAITSLSFSENGYYLATAAGDGVKLWDLRKLKNFRTFERPVGGVAFDFSGLYLAGVGEEATVYSVKQEWSPIKVLSDIPKKGATCVKWGADAKKIFIGSSDHNLRVYGQPA